MNAKPTPGPWKVAGEANGGKWIITEDPQCIGKEVARIIGHRDQPKLANAALIIAAANACFAVNPDNPQAVAEGLAELAEAAREFDKSLDYTDYARRIAAEKRLHAALARIEAK